MPGGAPQLCRCADSPTPGGSRFRDGRRLRRSGLVGTRRSGFALESKVLSLVVEDRAEKSVVVGGAFGGDLPQQKVSIPQKHCPSQPRGVLGGEGGVVALDR